MKSNLLPIPILAALTLAFLPAIHAETLIGFDFSGYQNSGPASSSSNAMGVAASSLSLPSGSGLSNNNQYPNNYDVRNDSDLTLDAAETDQDYIAFTVSPTAGNTVDVTSLALVLASFGGDVDLALTDSSNNVLATASGGNSSSNGYQEPVTLTLSGGDTLTTPTDFRLYAYGNQNADGLTPPSAYTLLFNNGGNDSFDINGTVTATSTPEPSSYALLVAGGLLLISVTLRRRGFFAL